MKLIGFLQVRNELSSGHLERFISVNLELFDYLYVYDDQSTDGTAEFIEQHASHVIRGKVRAFGSELANKAELLEQIKNDFDEGDAIIWLDADEVLYASKSEIYTAVQDAFASGYDSVALPHINLWRSSNWFRTDDNYDSLEAVRIWKLSSRLAFPKHHGLHGQMYPEGISAIKKLDSPSVVHFGFASTKYIIDKYVTYRSHWQSGYPLHRLISEHGVQLFPLSSRSNALGARYQTLHNYRDEEKPIQLSQQEWIVQGNSAYSDYMNQVKPRVTLVSLIYASTKWLEFTYAELLQLKRDLPEGEVEILFVANDASQEVLNYLEENGIPHIAVSTKKHQDEWFINSVYRAYNLGVLHAQTEYVYIVNSDMAYGRGTLANAMKEAHPNRLLASRLVELGVMPSGLYGIEKDFGSKPRSFRKKDFQEFVNKISMNEVMPGGLFMPLLVHKDTFLSLGGYPEGNIKSEHLADYLEESGNFIALQGENLIPGDAAFIEKARLAGTEHVTLMNSIAYHFQAGERRDTKSPKAIKSGIGIINDSIIGINGETVLWGKLAELLSDKKYKVKSISTGLPENRISHILAPLLVFAKGQRQIRKQFNPRILVTNASYQIPIFGPWRRVLILQDKTSGYLLLLLQKINLLFSSRYVSNDPDIVGISQGKKSIWLNIPLSNIWWAENESEKKPRHVIFVGAFNKTKGWPAVKELIEKDQTITWTLVSKYNEQPDISVQAKSRVQSYAQVSPEALRELMATSSALLVASPYETQCLVALEAASQNTPVVTTPTGTLGNTGIGTREFGVVTENLIEGLNYVFENSSTFSPRKYVKSLGLITDEGWKRWIDLLDFEVEESFRLWNEPPYILRFIQRLKSYLIGLFRRVIRSRVIPIAIKVKRALLVKMN